MGKTQRQRELVAAYKERTVVGGVCAIKNTVTGRIMLIPSADPEGQRNRFQFAQETGACLHPSMGADWREHGSASFTFTLLETLEKKPEQTDKQFQEELNLLAQIWRERLTTESVKFYKT